MEHGWDEAKRRSNLAKHGIDFAQVADFEWVSVVIEEDRRRNYGETRLCATGLIGERLHLLVFTDRDGRARIIGLRKANNREMAREMAEYEAAP